MFFAPLRTVGPLSHTGQIEKENKSEKEKKRKDFGATHYSAVLHFQLR
jgi:hypothetical protein